ncbi:ECF subfamily RNA polymerase sigma factor [Streptomyces lincolnensis]|uniref:ECF subfamily RNA polymerase sigma factor n=1 Tax=Streptomyces lincolnensis TaxID=1915 RepID=A0A1B1MQN7_STRLN|nr:sigma-70 family RNA polymerase sigma factor [Streptomyces lincolnensis]ANS70772.1 ECF subfamily RNA polymerase sigma factor [Streptomyces lincolnensis]
MTGQTPDDAGEQVVQESADMMPPAFWAFHELYHQAYFEYAFVQLGDQVAADQLVDQTFVFLAVIWQQVTEQEKPETLAWTLLKERVAAELEAQGKEPAALETLAFERAIRAACDPVLDSFRAEFRAQVTELEDSMGLYAALARLPERQFDVMVLHFALGFTTKRTALVMGVCEATVRSTRRAAKRRLAEQLGLDYGEDTDDEE